MSNDRKLDVLRSIVSSYVSTREPVSSRAVAAAQDLNVSTATIRNDMGVLEGEGLIYQPHTSAGRVPTEAGYRMFVDRLTGLRPLTEPQRRAIRSFLQGAADFEDTIGRAVRHLSQLTRSVAVVELPAVSTSTLRRVDVIDLDAHSLLVVVVNSAGMVQEQRVELGPDLHVTQELADQLRERLNRACRGFRGVDLVERQGQLVDGFPPDCRPAAAAVVEALNDMFDQQHHSRFIVGGMSYLARAGEDFADVSTILDALEEQVVLMRLFQEMRTGPLQVSIGAENTTEPLDQASVVSAQYQAAPGQTAHLGIIGPTRMDYPRSLVAVEAVARYLSGLLLE